ncbi:MAG: PQ-loop domain-containing transporter [Thermodesulfobacteriota bacterium]
MPSEVVVSAANICQMAVPFIAFSAYLPQWIKLIRTKSSRDISLRSWCIWTVSALCALFYAIVQLLLNGRGWPLVISTIFGLSSILFTVSLIYRYRPKGDRRES